MSNIDNDKILEEAAEVFDDLHKYAQARMLQAQAEGDIEGIQAIVFKHNQDETYREIIGEDSEIV